MVLVQGVVAVALQWQPAERFWIKGGLGRGEVRGSSTVVSATGAEVELTDTETGLGTTAAQGQVGIVNAKRIWAENQRFWSDLETPLEQEMIFASTGTKNPKDPPWKYVQAFAGSDILTNPPATNEAVAESSLTFTRRVDQLPEPAVLAEIDEQVDFAHLEQTLMDEGMKKFADPQKALLTLIAKKRAALASSP